jgi:acetyltransferase-like isoleucine patch superfamily enzyme
MSNLRQTKKKYEQQSWTEGLFTRLDRRLQLIRGRIVQWRGATVDQRFGLGIGVQIWHPAHLTVGNDVTILNYAFLNCLSNGGVRIGDNTRFHVGFWLRCDENKEQLGFFYIGSHCLIQAYGVMNASGGGITIGDHVVMGHHVSIHAGEHTFTDPLRRINEQGTVHQGIVIEDDCWIGAGATILDGVRIGRGSVIGAGAVVKNNIPPYSVAVGIPARVIKERKTTTEE